MTAYAALVSLMNTIAMEQIPHHTHHHNSTERKLMESLLERVAFLQEFLEGEWKGAKDLEGRIADAANVAEDAIESNIVDQVLYGSTSQSEIGSKFLCQDLQKAIDNMDSIKIEAIHVKENSGVGHQIPRSSISVASSMASPFELEENKMVGFEDEKTRIMEELARQHSSCQVISIVGMGGAGKTTLARNVYDDKYIVHYFYTRTWITVSQEHNVEEILRGILSSLRKQGTKENFMGFPNTTSDGTLGEIVYKSLSGKRYLIVLDDVWSVECWDNIKMFFPENKTGSRIVLTTRLSNVANQISTFSLDMKFLDEETSWTLFCKEVFAQKSCPPELEKIGKKIAQSCNGLPLALVVIGGLLKKSSRTLEFWEQVAEDVSSPISSDAKELCLEILLPSYNHLPIHLKPCFLYMGMFLENREICASDISKLWIAEGILKPIRDRSLEDIAESFLKELVERNLIMVVKWSSRGRIKSCKIHDLLRDLSLREALKEKNKSNEVLFSLPLAPLARSLTCNYSRVLPTLTNRLLRVLNVVDSYSYKSTSSPHCIHPLEVAFRLVNSRYLSLQANWISNTIFPSTICRLRNIQTIVVRGSWIPTVAPIEIWDMSKLRHIEFDAIVLPNPTSVWNDESDGIVLRNLHTLMSVTNFRCSEEILTKIPNIRNLKISYEKISATHMIKWPHYRLQNLERFQKLESLSCFFLTQIPSRSVLIQNLTFPQSLKKLKLHGCGLIWEDMTMIGMLPQLEVLKLKIWSFTGPDWNPMEGEFVCLKFLHIDCCDIS